MNDLQRYFESNTGRLIDKHTHYFDIYERYFAQYRNTNVTFLEIGIYNGGSLQMWKHYFGSKAKIIGVDINPECKKLEEDQIKIYIGNQADKSFLKQLTEKIPRPDIVLDDGGHFMDQQINTFEVLYPFVAPDGIYMCEDMHTSYWKNYGGGFKARGTFAEYSKYFIDYLHVKQSASLQKSKISDFAKSAFGIHYYDSILVIEKRLREESKRRTTGKPSFPLDPMRTVPQRIQARLSEYSQILRHKLSYRPYHRRD
jgi:23S rRNA U2552 (ribose-2'-O)-methylase RlmE/FtsJ